MKYRFTFYTGYGIGEIWAHTIKGYDLTLNAENLDDALQRVHKKMHSASSLNECFRNPSKCTIEVGDKFGIHFFKMNKTVWCGERLYWSPLVYEFHQLQSFILPLPKYRSVDHGWVANFLFKSIYPTYGDFMNKVYREFKTENDLQRYYYKQIEKLLASNLLTEEEKQSIQIHGK